MRRREAVDAKDAFAAPGEMIDRRTAHRTKPEHDGVESCHVDLCRAEDKHRSWRSVIVVIPAGHLLDLDHETQHGPSTVGHRLSFRTSVMACKQPAASARLITAMRSWWSAFIIRVVRDVLVVSAKRYSRQS
jgi:hypothetical protein